MCLLLVAVDAVPDRPLVILGNRDEFHARATDAAAAWAEDSDIVGGRDRVAGGSWLALRSPGRVAAVTNVRMREAAPAAHSRGELIGDFLRSTLCPRDWLEQRLSRVSDYAAFNLVVAVPGDAWCLQSPNAHMAPLRAGVHVISNGSLDEHWPKMRRLHASFEAAIAEPGWSDASLLDLLSDRSTPPLDELPDTGIGSTLEQFLAPIFIVGDRYGTRASTLVSIGVRGECALRE
ncbi:MAG: NRDE family protein [Tahibacter sp.]